MIFMKNQMRNRVKFNDKKKEMRESLKPNLKLQEIMAHTIDI